MYPTISSGRKPFYFIGKIVSASVSLAALGSAAAMGSHLPPLFSPQSDISEWSYAEKGPKSLKEKVQSTQNVVVVFLNRRACPYCIRFAPDFVQIAQEATKEGLPVEFGQIEFSHDAHIRDQQKQEVKALYGFELRTFPCVLFFKGGKLQVMLQGDAEAREPQRFMRTLREVVATP